MSNSTDTCNWKCCVRSELNEVAHHVSNIAAAVISNDKNACDFISTYIWDIMSLVLSEFFVVTQEEDGIFQGQSVVKVTLGLAFCCALHLERAQKTSERVIAHTSALNEFPHRYPLDRCIPFPASSAGLTFSSSARKLSRVSSDSLPTSNMVTAWLFRF